ncbi:MAG: hypothetical protein ACTSUE_24820 [Promethearchaeota archaeon]
MVQKIKRPMIKIMNADFKDVEFTKDSFGKCNLRGSVRLAMGKYYTDKEWERRRKRVLRKKL